MRNSVGVGSGVSRRGPGRSGAKKINRWAQKEETNGFLIVNWLEKILEKQPMRNPHFSKPMRKKLVMFA